METIITNKLNNKVFNVFRLDGHSFSNLTKKYFKKPFDETFSVMMKNTAKHLFEKYNFEIGFVGSDEITLVWYPLSNEQIEKGCDIPFGDRQFKIITLLAGLASSYFTKTFITTTQIEQKHHCENILDVYPHFDCRHFEFDTLDDVLDNIKYRITYTQKNSKMMYAQHFINHKKLQNVNSDDAIKMVQKEHNKNYYDDVSLDCQVGNILYKVNKICTKQLDNKTITFIRKETQFTNKLDEVLVAIKDITHNNTDDLELKPLYNEIINRLDDKTYE
jgi:tRNA(His) 5'-end guanylyltransferase